jgi:hypothetical protein
LPSRPLPLFSFFPAAVVGLDIAGQFLRLHFAAAKFTSPLALLHILAPLLSPLAPSLSAEVGRTPSSSSSASRTPP